jgi:hypothetical protein
MNLPNLKKVKIISILLIIFTCSSIYGQSDQNYFIGNWYRKFDRDSTKIQYIEFKENGKGRYGYGVITKGNQIIKIPASTYYIDNWEYLNDSLFIRLGRLLGAGIVEKEMTFNYLIIAKNTDNFEAICLKSVFGKVIMEWNDKTSLKEIYFRF